MNDSFIQNILNEAKTAKERRLTEIQWNRPEGAAYQEGQISGFKTVLRLLGISPSNYPEIFQ